MTLKIDGSHGEGGGQILRTALSLAAIRQQPVEIHNIRSGRKKPGLRPQHLMAVKAMALITAANVKGAELGSMRLYFEPRQITPGSYSLDIGTAGSTSLVLQTMIPALLIAKKASRVDIIGGTHVPWSPCFHYLQGVFVPALQEMGGALRLEMKRWGWYPKGGGKVIAFISPVPEFCAVGRTWRGKLEDTYVLSAVSNLPMSIAERQRDQVLKRFRDHGYKVPRIELLKGPSPGTGTVVFVRARFEKGTAGFTSLGKKGKPAEQVADDACLDFFEFMASGAVVDDHLADQLVLYMALSKGHSSLTAGRITKHLMTNMWVIEQFLPTKFEVDEETGRVSVEGVGFST
ncbi:MAG: RNA 3'-phosphate cyclase [Deltaproteobacteria bacterium]|nr:RNA 3'-phosphate cyclase [Deltaproteobacteria bacterium]MBW2019757.1 RNA 3'-phosphate cyclase [Deltaproteobacteria bacterium]MBW2074573.1 RNA 3'-phosphate cyclase [Deltaproteobacteria bacterium]RLB83514.1 MAG: RNA 3'-phosphate cyclase [Deltaproteobacteria bacterium]